MNLWKFFDAEFVHKKSNRKLFEVCREHFLSYVRMREWRDLAGQLREMASDLHIRENREPAPYDRERARQLFIEGPLAAAEFDSPHPFWTHTRKLVRDVEELEHRARRPDVLVDERAIKAFYDARIPADVRDARSFDVWYRTAS